MTALTDRPETETETKTYRRGTKVFDRAFTLPGFPWKGTAALGHSDSLVALRALSVAEKVPGGMMNPTPADLLPRYSATAMRAAFDTSGNFSMRDDGQNVSICYRGDAWFSVPSDWVFYGVPADFIPRPAPVDVFEGQGLPRLETHDDAKAHSLGEPVKVTATAALHGFRYTGPGLARAEVSGYVCDFEAARAFAAHLHRRKFAADLPAGMADALELVVMADRNGPIELQTLSLWYPAANDDTAAGYGVTVQTDPHAAAVARLFARAKVSAMNESKGRQAVTVIREDRGDLDPLFYTSQDAHALPEAGCTHVAHYSNGHGGGLKVITNGAEALDTAQAGALRLSGEVSTTVRVYELTTPEGPRYVYAADAGGRVIDARLEARQVSAYAQGRPFGMAAPAVAPKPEALPEYPLWNPHGNDESEDLGDAYHTPASLADAPYGVGLHMPGGGAFLAEFGLPGGVEENPAPARFVVQVSLTGLEPYSRLVAAAHALRQGAGNLNDLYSALDAFMKDGPK